MIVVADGVQYQPRMITGAFVFLDHFDLPKPSKWRRAVLRCFGGAMRPRPMQPIKPASSANS
jgi:hypothetical protein